MNAQSDILATRYGGLIPIVREMVSRGLPELIDSTLNEQFPLKHNAKYKYSSMFLSWIAGAMCGAKRIDNITDLMIDMKAIPGLEIPSHDTIGRMMKRLACEEISMEQGAKNENLNFYDENPTLNKLLIHSSVLMGILNTKDEYILDVDCTFIPTRCIGAISMKGKDQQGFNPMICLIGNIPVFISMRNGNSLAGFRISETIEQCLILLSEAGIKIKKVRTDGAGYRRDLVQMLKGRDVELLTASPVSDHFKSMLKQIESTSWRDVTIETANAFRDCQLGEIEYTMSVVDENVRVIALRVPTEKTLSRHFDKEEIKRRKRVEKKMDKLKKKGKLKSNNKRYASTDWSEKNGYQYKMITTTDFSTPAEELILLYNSRGSSERRFDWMKNDFGWRWVPYQWMAQNTVFLIISAMASNVFRAVAKIFNEQFDEVKLNARVRRFQKIFINAIAIFANGEWTYRNAKIDLSKIA